MSKIKNSFRADLQGLRAIAIILIVFAHSSLEIFEGGFVGVDVFFVLSGFLITGLLQKELVKSGEISLMNFYARRLKRLLPALLFMILTVFVLAHFILTKHDFSKQLVSSNYAITWISNLFFTFRDINYFDELSEQDLFLHTWSLGVEEQFYLVWPFVIGFVFKLNQRLKPTYNYSLIMVFFISLTTSILWTFIDTISAFYLMPFRIWQFTLGALTYFCINSQHKLLKNLNATYISALQIIGILFILSSGFFLKPSMYYPGFWALIPSFGSALIIFTGAYINQNNNILSLPIFVWLGDHSYSFYLWHWPVLILGFSLGFESQILPTILMIVIALFMAKVSLVFIEKPFWKGKLSNIKPRKAILISMLMTLISFILILPSFKQELPNIQKTKSYDKWRADVPVIYQKDCDDWYHSSRVIKCEFGNQEALKTVVVMGDSMLAQWYSAISLIYGSPSWKIIVMTKSACPMIDKDFYYKTIRKTYKVCTEWRNAALLELDKLAPDVAIIGNSIYYDFTDEEVFIGSTTIIERVSKAAKNVFVIPGTPSLTFDGPSCLNKLEKSNKQINPLSCSANYEDIKVQKTVQTLKEVTSNFTNVHFLNLNDLVCPNEVCSAINNKTVVYRDSYHITDTFVRSQVKRILPKINNTLSDEFY